MRHDPVLVVKELCLQIPTQEGLIEPVSGVSFTINPGQIFSLVGESGSGKTLTALSINRLLPESAQMCIGSEIFLDKLPIHELSEKEMRRVRGKKVAMIFQDPALALNPVLTVGKQIHEAYSQKNAKLSASDVKEKSIELLRRVKIAEPEKCLDKYPHELSGGMKQRIMIAIALSREPELLIADEPTTALDVTTQAEVLTLLKELNEKLNMAILFITHDLGVVNQISDTIAVMQQGKIVEVLPKKDFFKDAKHPYSLKLINAMPEKLPQTHESPIIEPDEKPLLKVENLKIYFPIKKGIFKRTVGYVKAVDDVSLELYEGQTLAVVGESGSGKTTFGKAILRLIPTTEGKVEFLNQNFLTLNTRQLRKSRGSIQMIFQDPYSSVDPRMTVEDIIEEGMLALNIGSDKAERKDRIRVLMEDVDLSSKLLNRYPHELSGGQRQRVSIARAMAVGARLIVCDEPTSSLDLSVQAQILKLLRKLQDDLAISYLFITHNMSVVKYLADNVAVMYRGKIVEYGTKREVFEHPKHDYTKALLASVPT